ncbi:hypothetical protein WUBG_15945 [Wuchereria bancrofti]|uniref:Uncharacterized protein n=1 Tax=Wuchereria bancrofti TaxID=6293 RepID=J9DU26_WUCBA|nr:hypothetical protein WUBG_15945 [Wuchereria bancrofti]
MEEGNVPQIQMKFPIRLKKLKSEDKPPLSDTICKDDVRGPSNLQKQRFNTYFEMSNKCRKMRQMSIEERKIWSTKQTSACIISIPYCKLKSEDKPPLSDTICKDDVRGPSNLQKQRL